MWAQRINVAKAHAETYRQISSSKPVIRQNFISQAQPITPGSQILLKGKVKNHLKTQSPQTIGQTQVDRKKTKNQIRSQILYALQVRHGLAQRPSDGIADL